MHNTQIVLSILKRLNVSGVSRKSSQIIEIQRTPPNFNWIKCNTDGMALGCPGVAAIGGIFRTYRGFSKGCFCLNISIQTAFVAELTAFIQAIDLDWDKQWLQLWLELDSQAVVQCVNNPSFQPPWHFLTRWKNCKHKMNRMQTYVTHTYREGNAVADKLSKMGLQSYSLQWWNSFRPCLSSFLSHDYASLPYYRFRQ